MKKSYVAPTLLIAGRVVQETLSGPQIGNEVAEPLRKHPLA